MALSLMFVCAVVLTSHLFACLEAALSKGATLADAPIELRRQVASQVPEDALACSQLFFLVNVPATNTQTGHWYFLRAHLKEGYIAAVDSCGATRERGIRLVQQLLEHLHTEALSQEGKPPSERLTVDWRAASLGDQTPQQTDWVSCGVYMLVAVWCCMAGVPIESRLECRSGAAAPSARSASYWRDRISLSLYRGRLG